jgi:hypothetical protein
MPVATRGEELRPLCIEHHAEIKLGIDVNPQRSPLFVCHVPGCMIRCNSSDGYLFTPRASPSEPQTLPRVSCRTDGVPMYLAEVKRQNPSYRSWRCPRCSDQISTNG